MIEAIPRNSPPRSFFVLGALAIAMGLAVGGVVLARHSFALTMQISTGIGSVAAGFASIIKTPWSAAQRASLLIAAGALGVAFGMIARFVF